jgi:hypothetical protein
MFGGLAFLWRGRMSCGIVGGDLMVRVPLDEFDAALRKPHVRPMDFTGRPLKGFVYVSPPGFRTATALGAWVSRGRRAAKAADAAKSRQRRRQPGVPGVRRYAPAGRSESRDASRPGVDRRAIVAKSHAGTKSAGPIHASAQVMTPGPTMKITRPRSVKPTSPRFNQ